MSILEKIGEPEKFRGKYGNELRKDTYSERWFYDLSEEEQEFVLNDATNTRIQVFCENELMYNCNLAEWFYLEQFYVGFEPDAEGRFIEPAYLNLRDTGFAEIHGGLAGCWQYKVVD